METNTANGISHILKVDLQQANALGAIRHWNNIKMATADGFYWLKDFSPAQAQSVALKTIPGAIHYYLRDNLLFSPGGLVPIMRMPSGLIWTPIGTGLKLSLPAFNHNFFGITEKITLNLVAAETEMPPIALLVQLNQLAAYMEGAPAIRLAPVSYTIMNNQYALMLGQPLLPLPGKTFWRCGQHLIPTGLQLNYPLLAGLQSQNLACEKDDWLFWPEEDICVKIKTEDWQALSISSFRMSMNLINAGA